MKSSLALTLLTAALFAAGCSVSFNSSNNANVSNANSNPTAPRPAVKDDLDELATLATIPFKPLDGAWVEDEFVKPGGGGGGGRKLTAVLLFEKPDADKIVAQAQGYRPPNPEVFSAENWYPSELVAQSQTSGDETLKGTSYGANDFYNAPFTEGKITRIEATDYFILELYAK